MRLIHSNRFSRGVVSRLFIACFAFLVISHIETASAQVTSDVGLGNQTEAPNTDDSQPEAAGIPITPLEIVQRMKWTLVPFVLASVIAMWFGIERFVVLRRRRVIPRAFVDRFLHHLEADKLNRDTALDLCEQNGSPLASVFAHGIRKWGKPSVEVEQAIIDGGERQISQLRRHLRVINGVATVTPLMGLLGTVVGMIRSFNELGAIGDPGHAGALAGGIAFALLTTAFGLAIAIPCLIVYLYLTGRVDALVMEMDLLAQDVVNLISAEALASRLEPATIATGLGTDSVPAESKKAV